MSSSKCSIEYLRFLSSLCFLISSYIFDSFSFLKSLLANLLLRLSRITFNRYDFSYSNLLIFSCIFCLSYFALFSISFSCNNLSLMLLSILSLFSLGFPLLMALLFCLSKSYKLLDGLCGISPIPLSNLTPNLRAWFFNISSYFSSSIGLCTKSFTVETIYCARNGFLRISVMVGLLPAFRSNMDPINSLSSLLKFLWMGC